MRKENWDTELFNFINSKKYTSFQWGVHDCIMFAVGCAQAMTGIDLAEKYRGYATEDEAMEIIKVAGGFKELVTENMGKEISPKMARRGDWVLLELNEMPSLAVCLGSQAMGVRKESGLALRPMPEAKAAWRIN